MNDSDLELLQLKNLGIASVNILQAVGVRSIEDLQTLGAVEVYKRIQSRGFSVSKVMLYALHGALEDIYWNELDTTVKQNLVEKAAES